MAYEGVQSLDVTGPAEVFAHAAREPDGRAYEVVLASRRGGRVTTSSGLVFETRALVALRGPVDAVIVAGGNERGVTDAAGDAQLLAWLRRRAPAARRFGSVCSGAFVLAAAGLLDGLTVATHWKAASRLSEMRPAVSVDADAIYVRTGRVWTSAGITTGIDMALAMVEEDCGRGVADRVAAHLVLHARRPGFQSQFSDVLAAQARRDDPLGGVVAWANAHLGALDVDALARRAAVSVRTLHRLTARAVGCTPAKLIERLRVEHARVQLATTDLPLKAIADRCGFRDAAQLTRSFARRFGVTPRAFRLLRGDAAA
ncbi:MAG TPA: helix-turn-helix domain-containing protein [Polyangia bacterium]|nr:helix-turn-helix domain-containing protein [Polyangia bacterium]